MHDVLHPDHILMHDGQKVPRFAHLLPNSLIVPEGETFTLPQGESAYDAVEVAGTLVFPRTGTTRLFATHVLVTATGHLDMGTDSDPITGRAEIVFRDVTLDLVRDPWQWGNGLLNFGAQTRVGLAKTPFVQSAGDIAAGATTLTLATVPSGWQVGDELLIPDTQQLNLDRTGGPFIRRESPVFIAAIDGATVTLSKPLDFAHNAVRRPDGSIAVFPRVANLTRNVVIRSENPAGTRGHTANVGHVASWDVQANQLIGVGRTTFATLNNTKMVYGVLVPGTNQIGKYADHDHHCGSRPDLVRQTIGCTYDGKGGSKWAKVVHGTHDVLVKDNVAIDFQGGCFVTEDGYESRNVFDGNFAAYALSNGERGSDNADPTKLNAPGAEGVGFWFRGCGNIVTNNEAWNNAQGGISFFNQNHVGIGTNTIPGRDGSSDVLYTRTVASGMVPIAAEDNVTGSNQTAGVELWASPRFPLVNTVSVGNGSASIWVVQAGTNMLHAVNPLLIGGPKTSGVSSSSAYTDSLLIDGGEIRGHKAAFVNGGAFTVELRGSLRLQNIVNYSGEPKAFTQYSGPRHEPMPGLSSRYFDDFSDPAPWAVGEPIRSNEMGFWAFGTGSRWVIYDWQGTGQNYRMMTRQQLAGNAAPPAVSKALSGYVPEAGLTLAQAWATYGMAMRGDVTSGAHTLEGLIDLFVEPGAVAPFGPPRAVVTYPNRLSPAVTVTLSNGSKAVDLEMLLTGGYATANTFAVVSVDGATPVRLKDSVSGVKDRRRYRTTSATPGTHTVTTWREDVTGAKIPASEMTFEYYVGDVPPPPPPPPDPVHCVQGEWVAGAPEFGPWVNAGDSQTRTVTTTHMRPTITEPANGGTACGPSTKTEVTTEVRPMPWMDVLVQLSADDRVRVVRPDGSFKEIS